MRVYTQLSVVQPFYPSDLLKYFNEFSVVLINYLSSFGLLIPYSLPLFLLFHRNSLLSPSIPHMVFQVGIYLIPSVAKIDGIL